MCDTITGAAAGAWALELYSSSIADPQCPEILADTSRIAGAGMHPRALMESCPHPATWAVHEPRASLPKSVPTGADFFKAGGALSGAPLASGKVRMCRHGSF